MPDHSIHFTSEQNLLLDKLVADKEAAQALLATAQRELQEAKQQILQARGEAQSIRAELSEAQKASGHPDEEAIRQDERERFAQWIENGGHDDEYIYMMTDAAGAMAISDFVPSAIRRAKHMMTYAEYRREGEPDWPEGYDMGEGDYPFDVNTTVWDRAQAASAPRTTDLGDLVAEDYKGEW